LLCLLMPYAASAAGAFNVAAETAVFQDVRVVPTSDGVDVQITASEQVGPETSVLHSPERLMLDLPNTRLDRPRKLGVRAAGVIDIRVAQHSTNPPTTRVVIDLEHPCTYNVVNKGATVVVQLRGLPSAAEKPVAATAHQQQDALPPTPNKSNTPVARQAQSVEAGTCGNATGYKYTGAGGCAASSCHGSVQPKATTRIFQNEYTIWVGDDKHANAYTVLSNPVSVRMGEILKVGAPEHAAKCLACHALDVTPEQRTQKFGMDDGVSCENCHGPSSGWLGPHTQANWPHEKSVKLGMYDTRNMICRSAKCASCHVGSAEKFVDHAMIAAGHPDLTFELEFFTRAMPQHWKMPEDPWSPVKAWAVGGATQLSASLRRLAWRASLPTWPEYGELECFACHHSLTMPNDSWRQKQGYAGRRPGTPPWNVARYVVFRHLVEQVNPENEKQLSALIMKISDLIGQPNGKGAAISTAAQDAADLCERIAHQLESQRYDQAFTLQLMRSIADDANIGRDGERSAEQAYMSLETLFEAYHRNVKLANDGETQAAITGLFQQFNNPSAYNAPRFALQMQKVQSLLGSGNSSVGASK